MLAARRQAQATMLPYRDDCGTVRYAPAPGVLHETTSIFDDDGLPLISNAAYLSQDEGDSDPTQRFTATGGPMPAYRPSVYVSMNMYSAPQHLPQKYTDDSIIPVVVQVPDPLAGQRKKSFMDKFKGEKSGKITKVIFMPRGEYLKRFAKDYEGRYIGTEPQKEWTLEELDEKYGKYKKDLTARRGQRGQTMTMGLNA